MLQKLAFKQSFLFLRFLSPLSSLLLCAFLSSHSEMQQHVPAQAHKSISPAGGEGWGLCAAARAARVWPGRAVPTGLWGSC